MSLTRVHDAPGRRMADGTLRLLLADAVALPAGLVLAAYLTRRLGPSSYGVFITAAAITASLEWTFATVFSRATIKIIGDAADPTRAGAALVRLQLAASVVVATVVWLFAGAVAQALELPALAWSLRLFALDIPLFTLASVHWQIGVGLGLFRPRAAGSLARWFTRLALAAALVESGFSIDGAIAASIGASAVELFVARRYIQPPLWRATGPLTAFLPPFVLPLVMYALSMRLLDKVDLFMLSALGAGAATAGLYGAAQSLALLPGLFAQALAPLTLATVNRLLRDGLEDEAREIARQALRAVLWLLPFAAIVAGSARRIVTFVFGAQYQSAAGPLSWLIAAAVAQAAIGVAAMILTARDRPGLMWAIGGALCPLALLGHLLAIPVWGAGGAAAVTTAVSFAGAVAMWTALGVSWQLWPSVASLCRAVVASALGYVLAFALAGSGAVLPLELFLVVVVVAAAQLAMGEFTRSDWEVLRA